jgi:hypothetical protein
VFFGIGLIVPETRDNELGRIGLWCGFIAMLLEVVATYLEIRRSKKGQNDNQA